MRVACTKCLYKLCPYLCSCSMCGWAHPVSTTNLTPTLCWLSIISFSDSQLAFWWNTSVQNSNLACAAKRNHVFLIQSRGNIGRGRVCYFSSSCKVTGIISQLHVIVSRICASAFHIILSWSSDRTIFSHSISKRGLWYITSKAEVCANKVSESQYEKVNHWAGFLLYSNTNFRLTVLLFASI